MQETINARRLSRSALHTHCTHYNTTHSAVKQAKTEEKKRVIINLEPRGRFDIICEGIIIIKKIRLLLQGEFRFQNADVLE